MTDDLDAPGATAASCAPVLAAMEEIRSSLAAVDGDLGNEAKARARARRYANDDVPVEPFGSPPADAGAPPD